MAPMKQPPLGLYGTVLDVLSGADPWRHSAAAVMSRLVEHLSIEEAECLPYALGDVLALLRGDLDRLHLAVELAVRFDFFEIAGSVTAVAEETDDEQLLLNAADLAANTAADVSVRRRIVDQSLGELGQRRAIQLRLDQTVVPRTIDEERLYELSWPGSRTDRTRFPLPPVVVVDASLRADRALRLVVEMVRVGATVRRFDADAEIPFWFGAETVLVCREATRQAVRGRYPQFPEAHIVVPEGDDLPARPADQDRLLRRLNAALPGTLGTQPSDGSPDLVTPLWAPEIFTAGVYTTREAAFLAGAETSSLAGLRRRNLLRPHGVGVLRWNFRDVVAVRTWTYLKASSPGPVPAKVVGALASFEGDSDAVRLGVTTDGRVMADRGTGFEDVLTGQGVLDLPVEDVDAAFRPFEFGNNRIPDLLRATANSALHPACLHGTPHLSGHRISAKDLASLDRAGGRATVVNAYPELDAVAFDDVVSVGHQLLALV